MYASIEYHSVALWGERLAVLLVRIPTMRTVMARGIDLEAEREAQPAVPAVDRLMYDLAGSREDGE